MKKQHENKYAIYLLTDDLLHIIYKKGKSIDLEAAQIIVRDRMVIQEGVSLLVLCDIRELRIVNKPARDFFAIEGSLFIKALAFLIDPPVTDAMSEFYLSTHRTPMPTASFSKKSEAMDFLQKATMLAAVICMLPWNI
ncbi:hypothetical protein [Flagellimonas algicola]|uniref:DUF7793 domain-containing protein n=1 Tax=Flagellimonas algicola TaxID=2583815 RepID=A0ABY2WGR0_9FLAO|nr:hypothetical protein [Allomuricauda algicola]TMU50752.1 hypothetical protein FGG15_18315 [Allomuricauda algicola]